LLTEIPVDKVKEFENEFLEYLELKHNNILKDLALGKLSKEITDALESTAKEIVEKFKQS
jgi:F-type H+-transporting ATPase subunit alpha